MEMFEYIESVSKELNIDIIGFTDNKRLDLEEFLYARKTQGKIAEFEEKSIEKRIDPKLSMEDVRSIIVIGISYNTGFQASKKEDLEGQLSMSSWGLDYHKVVQEKMDKLIEKIKEKKDFKYKSFVDTGPLIERELARKANIGYYGKNCSIINQNYGSFIFLGHILTDMDLKSSKPSQEDCGDCNRCIRACPTGALEKAYSLDTKKCISYLTQTKEEIPLELREKMGRSIYGCDICQRVCPKNRDVQLSKHKEFIPSKTAGVIDLKTLLTISNRKFKKEYGAMSGSWRGKNILKRNAIIALGNIADKKNIPLLLEARENSNDSFKDYIDVAIERILKNPKSNKEVKTY